VHHEYAMHCEVNGHKSENSVSDKFNMTIYLLTQASLWGNF
jgi:hypothetical protein